MRIFISSILSILHFTLIFVWVEKSHTNRNRLEIDDGGDDVLEPEIGEHGQEKLPFVIEIVEMIVVMMMIVVVVVEVKVDHCCLA